MPWQGRYPRAEGGASRPESLEYVPWSAAGSRRRPVCRDGACGRMEWRVEGPRHKSDKFPSACRSLPVRQARYGDLHFWGAITLMSLFAGAVMASPHQNQTMRAASDGNLGTASPASMEDNSRETSSLPVWSHRHGENVTLQGLNNPELLRAERSPLKSGRGRKNNKRSRNGNRRYCSLRSLRVKVRDLGLGFESDEVVRFKYCSGSCQRTRTNYDVTLSWLLQERATEFEPHERDLPSAHPCCRPTRFEDFSFMDVHNAWQAVAQISAAECGCVG
uniref:Artemin n=1 Tax=Salvator merianae TaxID=96440 RepID=A0A8D0DY45_SALMN